MRAILNAILLLLLTARSLDAQEPTTTPEDTTSSRVALLLSGRTPEQRELFMRKWRLITGAALDFRHTQSNTEMSFILRSRPLALTQEELQQFAPPRDFVGEELYRRQVGTVPPLNLNPIFQSLAHLAQKAVRPGKRPGRLTAVPSPLEADVLATLWQRGPATRGDVYARLDTVWRLTALDLDQLLEEMVDKGLLARKKISPENSLSILTPLGVVSVEKSQLNRKNVDYIYWPVVDRQQLITFLDAQLYLASTASPVASNGRTVAYQQLLLETLYRLSAAATP